MNVTEQVSKRMFDSEVLHLPQVPRSIMPHYYTFIKAIGIPDNDKNFEMFMLLYNHDLYTRTVMQEQFGISNKKYTQMKRRTEW